MLMWENNPLCLRRMVLSYEAETTISICGDEDCLGARLLGCGEVCVCVWGGVAAAARHSELWHSVGALEWRRTLAVSSLFAFFISVFCVTAFVTSVAIFPYKWCL